MLAICTHDVLHRNQDGHEFHEYLLDVDINQLLGRDGHGILNLCLLLLTPERRPWFRPIYVQCRSINKDGHGTSLRDLFKGKACLCGMDGHEFDQCASE